MTDTWTNQLYFGDNLKILREHIADASVDLVYLDPPFNSNASYNVLFKEQTGEQSTAQITAFEDTWQWGGESELTYSDSVTDGPKKLSELLQSMMSFLGRSNMMAYITMMAPRLLELHRVLRNSGSLYLHCDPSASHYLKLLLDAIFSPSCFRNEIVWRRTNARSTKGRWPRVHDILFFYTKSEEFTFHPLQIPGDLKKIPHTLISGPDGKKYQTYELTAPGVTRDGDSGKPWRGFDPAKLGRHWANSLSLMEEWDRAGLIHWPKRGGWPRRKDSEPFRPEARMIVVDDVWTDIDRLNQSAKERLGYPTQKPEALLDRILEASSDEGDIVLDPFCGCGTTIASAERLRRRWIGIDITHLAITLIRHRLLDTHGETLAAYEIHGVPTDVSGAKALAAEDPFQFEWWALGLVDARPAGNKKKGADQGIDGVLYFFDDESNRPKKVIVQVKSGKVSSRDIRDLRGAMDREKATLACFVTLQPATRPMKKEALAAGVYVPKHFPSMRCPRLQIFTIGELLGGARLDYPRLARDMTFRKAKAAPKRKPESGRLFEDS